MSTTITFLPVKFETSQVLGWTDILSSISSAQALPSSSPCLCAISRPLCAVTHFESGSQPLVVTGDAELSQLIRAPRGVPVVPVGAYGMFCRLQRARICVGGTGTASRWGRRHGCSGFTLHRGLVPPDCSALSRCLYDTVFFVD